MYRPSPKTAAVRLICLTSLTVRSLLEHAIAQAGPAGRQDGDARIDGLLDWLRQQRLWNRLSVCERQAMAKPSGTWDGRERTNASWRLEAAGVVAWSLRLLGKIPAYDTGFSASSVWAVAPRIGEATEDFIRTAMFRPEAEIRDAREITELWRWRARTAQLQADAEHTSQTSPERYTEYVRSAAKKGMASSWFIAINEDFPAFGKSYAELTPEEHGRATSIAQERLWGLNWLCGPGRNWDRVLLDT
jgi:hypothetical protein